MDVSLLRRVLVMVLPLVVGFPLFDAGCQPPAEAPAPASVAAAPPDTVQVAVPEPVVETKADSVALRMYEASGGRDAWAAWRYAHFTFSLARERDKQIVYRHFWDRMTGAYRFERPGPANEPYVVLYNVNTREGQAFYDGMPEDSVHTAQLIDEAYRRFINDSYWLLAPLKVFDPGVNRAYVADSSDASHDVLHLTFGDVGLTPGDQYWLYVSKETGRLDGWSYLLENAAPPPRRFRWMAYKAIATPAGPLHLATQKHSVARPFSILTELMPVPDTLPEDFFTDPRPRLLELAATPE